MQESEAGERGLGTWRHFFSGRWPVFYLFFFFFGGGVGVFIWTVDLQRKIQT